jgi:hypothetical protein
LAAYSPKAIESENAITKVTLVPYCRDPSIYMVTSRKKIFIEILSSFNIDPKLAQIQNFRFLAICEVKLLKQLKTAKFQQQKKLK